MPQTATSDSGGLLLQLLTESFAFRALLGSLAAAALASLAVHGRLVHSTRARRLLVLAPVLVAVAAGLATARQASAVYLPQLFVASSSPGAAEQVLDLVDELRWISLDRELNLLFVAWLVIATVLLTRRVAGVLAVGRVLERGSPAGLQQQRLLAIVDDLSTRMGLRTPRVLLVEDCPGGAFATGTIRTVVAIDPALITALDDRELEGLVAHELAHLYRRDPLLCLVVGVFRDLTFFVPAASLAIRWLRHEQEESADQVAAELTTRPAALASSILKVWDRASLVGPSVACAAVPADVLWRAGRRPLVRTGVLTRATRMVSRRVERLISGDYRVTLLRRRLEIAVAVSVLATATGAAVAVPTWMAPQYSGMLIGTTPAAPDAAVESEVFATYRYLTRDTSAARQALSAPAGRAGAVAESCPCVESQAQLRQHVAATAPKSEPTLRWSAGTAEPYAGLRDSRTDDVQSARSLWTSNERQPRLGVFLLDGSG